MLYRKKIKPIQKFYFICTFLGILILTISISKIIEGDSSYIPYAIISIPVILLLTILNKRVCVK